MAVSEVKQNNSLFPILLVNFIDSLGFSIVIPFLVMLVFKLGGNELSYGFLGATYSAFQMLGSPLLGRWSDLFGRKKILLLSEIGTFLGWTIFFIALLIPVGDVTPGSSVAGIFMNTFPLLLLFIARAVDGITGGNISVAYAYLADFSGKQDRKKNYGKMTASQNIGFIIGPAMAGVLGATALGLKTPALAAMLISLLAVLVIIFRLKDVKPATENVKSIDKVKIFKLPFVPYFLLLYFLIYLAFNFFYVAFPVYVAQQLHWTVFQLGLFFSVLSGVMVIIQGPVLSKMSSRFSDGILVIAGGIILSAGFVLFSSANTITLYAGAVLFSCGNGLMWPSFLASIANATDDRYQGAVQGFAGSMGSMASIIGLISGAFLYKMFGSAVMLLSAIFIFLISLYCTRILRIEKIKK
jgi:MFS family permease